MRPNGQLHWKRNGLEPLWFSGILAQEWIDKGVVAGRKDLEQLEAELKQTRRNFSSAYARKLFPTAVFCIKSAAWPKLRTAALSFSFESRQLL